MTQLVHRVDRHEADDGDGIVDVWPTPNPQGEYITLDGPNGTNMVPVDCIDWVRGRWWRAVGPDGKVWAEASDEDDVRGRMRPGDKLYYDRRAELIEWVPADA